MVYKCPICEGRGFVYDGFYGNTKSQYYTAEPYGRNTCRACYGTGIIRDFATPVCLPALTEVTNPNEGKEANIHPDGDKYILACPRCGSGEYLHNEDGNQNEYCGQCGQKLEWGEEKDT